MEEEKETFLINKKILRERMFYGLIKVFNFIYIY